MKELGSLPPSYGENTLVALVQGPNVVFVYWELTQEMWRLLNAGRPVLRLYEAGGEQNALLEEVSPYWHTGRWYFRHVSGGRSYRCELGLWEGETFYSFLRSDRVDTPSCEIAGDAGRRLMVPMPVKLFQRDDRPGSSGFGPEGERS